MRGRPWGIQKVHKILSSRTYAGEYLFNVRDSKTLQKRAPADWIRYRRSRSSWTKRPSNGSASGGSRERQLRPRRAACRHPTLLTGLLRCGHCGGAMTLTTGKSGKYRYYKCTTRVNKGGTLCYSRNLPMETVDNLVLKQLRRARLHAHPARGCCCGKPAASCRQATRPATSGTWSGSRAICARPRNAWGVSTTPSSAARYRWMTP